VEEPGSTLVGIKYESASILTISGIGEPGGQSIVMKTVQEPSRTTVQEPSRTTVQELSLANDVLDAACEQSTRMVGTEHGRASHLTKIYNSLFQAQVGTSGV
jgi:hypothetical protein